MGKKSDEMSDRELLIRIDERTAHLPKLKNKVERHEVTIAILSVVMVFVLLKTYPTVIEALAHVGR
jgi:hypothetical protein